MIKTWGKIKVDFYAKNCAKAEAARRKRRAHGDKLVKKRKKKMRVIRIDPEDKDATEI